MIRKPAVANQFYPGDAQELAATIKSLAQAATESAKVKALAVIAPHAGYIYSGRVAAETFARILVPDTVMIIGPNHHGIGAPCAIISTGSWAMPLGEVPINTELSELIKHYTPEVQEDGNAHRLEHSLEVQLPFLQTARPGISLSPLVVSHLHFSTCQEIGRGLAKAIKEHGRPVLMVASTDMNHYEPRSFASQQDHLALARVEALDPKGLYRTVIDHGISMCGFIPTTIVLIAALELGATQAKLVCYSDSGEASGDISQVVGYAGVIIN